MAQMNTDAAALAAEASNFDRISNELQQVIRRVDSTGGELAGQWRGQAGTAAQQALQRFRTAGQSQIKELNEISAAIRQAGVRYTSSDQDQAGALSAQMNF